jgi:hypothetical protein
LRNWRFSPTSPTFAFDRVLDGLFAVLMGEGRGVVGGVGCGERVGDVGDEGLEVLVFGNEVGFAVQFKQDAGSGGRR